MTLLALSCLLSFCSSPRNCISLSSKLSSLLPPSNKENFVSLQSCPQFRPFLFLSLLLPFILMAQNLYNGLQLPSDPRRWVTVFKSFTQPIVQMKLLGLSVSCHNHHIIATGDLALPSAILTRNGALKIAEGAIEGGAERTEEAMN